MTVATYKLPVGNTLSTAWHKVKGSKATFWTAIALMILIAIAVSAILVLSVAFGAPAFVSVILRVFAQVFNNLIALGLLYIGIRRAADLPIETNQLFIGLRGDRWLKLIGAFLLSILLIYVVPVVFYSLSLFLVSGIAHSVAFTLFVISVLVEMYVLVRLYMLFPLVLDKALNPWQAVKQSWSMTRGNFWRLLSLLLLMILFLILGAIPCLIGLIWALPFMYILFGLQYQRLLANNN